VKVSPEDMASVERAVNDPKVVDAILKAMGHTAKKAGLNGFETVKSIHVTVEAFTIENNLLTPTLKVRRRDAAMKFQDVIEKLYQ